MESAVDPRDARLWWDRIRNSENIWRTEKVVWDQLEDAVDGIYPDLEGDSNDQGIPTAVMSPGSATSWLRTGTQLDVNLMGQVRDYLLALAFDRFPSFKFSIPPVDDVEAVDALLELVRRLAEQGGAADAGRRAMECSMTRGQFILWPSVVRTSLGEAELAARQIPPAAWVVKALSGQWDGKLPLGSDYAAIAVAAETVIKDATSLAWTPEMTDAVWALKTLAEKMDASARKGPFHPGLRARLWWEALPFGTWFLPDMTVTDYRRAAWVSRKHVFLIEEFKRDPAFTQDAKDNVVPIAASTAPKEGIPVNGNTTDALRVADEQGRVVVREIIDRVHMKRIWIADGYDKTIGKDDGMPWVNDRGEPLFPDVFPVTYRTPITRAKEEVRRILGKPLLEPGYGTQIAFIKNISAYVRACEATNRVYFAGPGVTDASVKELERSKDMTVIRLENDYNAGIAGPPGEQFSMLPMPPAPIDFLKAAQMLKAQFASLVRVSVSALTSEPIADTVGQEEIALRGVSTSQADMVKVFEDGFAESVWKGLLMFLSSATDLEFQAYLGADVTASRDGKPPIYEVLRGIDFTGIKLECRFDSTTQAQNGQRLKLRSDLLAMSNNIRDPFGMPYVDIAAQMRQLYREADIEFVPFVPDPAMVEALMAQQSAGAKPGQDPNQRQDGRRANGERGAPPSPGRQERHRSEGRAIGDQAGAQARRATATS